MSAPGGDWYLADLACPDCGAAAVLAGRHLRCQQCPFETLSQRPLDMRPTTVKEVALTFAPATQGSPEEWLASLDTSRPAIAYDGPPTMRDSRELLAECSRHLQPQARVLDLGCGPRDQAAAFEHLGFRYVGFDVASPAADVWSDAHAIALGRATVDCIFSYAVLEHVRDPHVVMHEIERVLRPGGFLIGTVSQGEPFHSSYFHPTPWGLLRLVETTSRLRLVRLWESGDTLGALARMGRYPRPVKALLELVHRVDRGLPLLAPRRMRWSAKDRAIDRLYRAASLCFVIEKAKS